eukprot:6250295-Ditylum_brightwellii.AAC.1
MGRKFRKFMAPSKLQYNWGEIWWVTDGGLDDDIGYFGWVIAIDQQILWKNRGHTPGHEEYIETLRTEGISHLLLAVFMKHYLIFHEVRIDQDQTIHYCDNMEWYPAQNGKKCKAS